jgi:voltage-gated potassium channel
MTTNENKLSVWQQKLHETIFEADTRGGKLFDILLIASIVVSVIAVMLDTIDTVHSMFGNFFYMSEWFFTILFSVEYILRLASVGKPVMYARSFYGVIDLLAVIPTYMSLLLPGTQYLLVIRSLRVLRIFRIFKLVKYLSEAKMLVLALKASRRKIIIFMFTILTLVIIFGSLMYLIESENEDFSSIPRSIYWAVVTLTTVGYGDIAPQSPVGQTIAAIIMILGYAIIAVPTGIVTVEYSRVVQKEVSTQACPQCSAEGHDVDARFCRLCGTKL